MASCIKCHSIQDEDQQVYHVSDMCEEILLTIQGIIPQINDDGIICEQCFEEVMHEFDNTQAVITSDSTVCIWCRNSLFRRRSHEIPEGIIRDKVSARISPQVVTQNSLLCYSCWIYVNRLVRGAGNNQSASRPQNITTCAWCLQSLNRRRCHSLPEGPDGYYLGPPLRMGSVSR